MRKNFTLTALAMLFAFISNAQTTGGPDAFGYYWWNQNDAAGPTYNWIDITGKAGATQIMGLADDNSATALVNIGFDFRFYWTDYQKVKLGSNGWISFDNVGNIASCFPGIPTPAGSGDNLVCPMMSDLNFTTAYPGSFPNPAEMWTWSNGQDTFIVQYKDVPWWKNDGGGSTPPDWAGDNDFQVIFTSTDSSIIFQYSATTPGDLQVAAQCPTSLAIGIENLTGNIGLENSQNTVPAAGTAIRFYAPTALISIEDATPAWNANSDNQGQFFMTGSNVTMTTNVKNVGNATLTSATQVDGELESLSLSQIWSDAATVPVGLADGADTTISFPSSAVLTTAGQYYYNVSTSNSGDINPSNNDNTTEVSAIDCSNDSINMTYATMNPPDGSISWSSGDEDEGVGVYYVPPFYPVDISRIDVWVGSDGDSLTPMPAHGFTIRIFDGDVSTGPMNLLQTEFRGGTNTTEAAWNQVTLDTALTITSGGFFVGWFQNGDSLAIGTEAFGPISNRSYEILAGSWAEYRANTSEDMLISVHGEMNCSVANDPIIAPEPSVLTMFPNPTNSLLNIRFTQGNASSANFTIRDIYGKQISEKVFPTVAPGDYKFSIATEEFKAGIYFLTMDSSKGRTTQKFVVKH